MKGEAFHLAFKCTYNNGGEGRYVGFKGTCSNDIIAYNVSKSDGIWCSNKLCPCYDYFADDFAGERPNYPCLESGLFDDETGWRFGAGYDHTGDMPKARFIRNTEPGKIVMLTTRFPGKNEDKEERRRIIGFYRIGEITEDEFKNEETILWSDGEYNVKFPLMVASQTYFWDYYRNSGGDVHWGTGLYRYITAKQMRHIITDLINLLKSRNQERKLLAKLEKLLNENFLD